MATEQATGCLVMETSTRADYFRSFFGRRVLVKDAPQRCHLLIGGKFYAWDGGMSSSVLMNLRRIGGEGGVDELARSEETEWEFVAVPGAVPTGHLEERRSYDEKQFEQDLDEAIKQANEIVANLWNEKSPKLSFKPGETIESAMKKVVQVMFWRHLNISMHAELKGAVWRSLRVMLLEKNKNYGNSALNPVRIFATASPMEQLLVRLDDKVSRIERGQAAGEDVANDLLGYLILVLIAKIREARGQ